MPAQAEKAGGMEPSAQKQRPDLQRAAQISGRHHASRACLVPACTIFMSSRRRYATSFKAICPGRALARRSIIPFRCIFKKHISETARQRVPIPSAKPPQTAFSRCLCSQALIATVLQPCPIKSLLFPESGNSAEKMIESEHLIKSEVLVTLPALLTYHSYINIKDALRCHFELN